MKSERSRKETFFLHLQGKAGSTSDGTITHLSLHMAKSCRLQAVFQSNREGDVQERFYRQAMTRACQGSHCFSPDRTEGHLCPAAGTQRHTSISLSPAPTEGSLCSWDYSTLPWQTSPALQDLGPESIKTL